MIVECGIIQNFNNPREPFCNMTETYNVLGTKNYNVLADHVEIGQIDIPQNKRHIKNAWLFMKFCVTLRQLWLGHKLETFRQVLLHRLKSYLLLYRLRNGVKARIHVTSLAGILILTDIASFGSAHLDVAASPQKMIAHLRYQQSSKNVSHIPSL